MSIKPDKAIIFSLLTIGTATLAVAGTEPDQPNPTILSNPTDSSLATQPTHQISQPLTDAVTVSSAPVAQVAALDTLVVVATRHPRATADVVGGITSLSQTDLQERQIQALPDLVREIPGVDLDQADNRFGNGGLRIRGIGGNRVLTLIDGVPVADRFIVGNYGDSGRDYLDLGLVRQVEILRGPSSVLYGSKALGGVVSYETLLPRDLAPFPGEAVWGSALSAGYRSDREEAWLGSQAAYSSEQWDGLVAVGYRNGHERTPHQVPDKSRIDRQQTEQGNLLLKQVWHHSPLADTQWVLDVDERERQTDVRGVLGTGRFRNTTRMDTDDDQTRLRASVRHQQQLAEQTRLTARLYVQQSELSQFTDEWRQSAPEPVRQLREFSFRQRAAGVGADLEQRWQWGDWQHVSGVGFEWQYGHLAQRRDATQLTLASGESTQVLLGERFPLRDFPLTHTRDFGLYWQDEIQRTGSAWTLVPGVRFDRYTLASQSDDVLRNGTPDAEIVDMTDQRATPQLAVRWRASEQWLVAMRYLEGYRAPPPMDVNLALDIPAFNAQSLPNPDLKAERSRGLEVNLAFENSTQSVELAVFETRFRDFIQSRAPQGVDPDTGINLFQSINIDRARIRGVEVSYAQQLGAWHAALQDWRLESSAEWLRGDNQVTNQPLNDIVPPKAVFALAWYPADSAWSVRSVTTLSKGFDRVDETRQAQYQPGGYGLQDVLLEYRFASTWVARLGLYNLFDKHYFTAPAVAGRTPDDPLLPYLAASGRWAMLSLRGEF
jgi:hemoglobin/transferrin/lactoferrin receptor protein